MTKNFENLSIKEIQNKIKITKQAHINYEKLLKERESLIQNLNSLESELESNKSKFNFSYNFDSKNASKKKFLEIEEKELPRFKKKLQDIDHQLDELEGNHKKTLAILQEILVTRINSFHPENKKDYEELNNKLLYEKSKYKEEAVLLQALTKLQELLQQIFQQREHVKKRGILSYIFGKNPNLAISKLLEEITSLADKTLILFQNLTLLQSTSLFLEYPLSNTVDTIHTLSNLNNNQWNFKIIDAKFQPTDQKLLLLILSLKEKQKEQLHTIAEIEKTISDWIDERCKLYKNQ